MARYVFQTVMQDGEGGIFQSEGTVTVYTAGSTTKATVYESETGSQITDSEITPGSDGSVEFWVDDGDYASTQRFKITYVNGAISKTRDNLTILPGVTESSTDTLTNKTIDADSNTLSNLEIGSEVKSTVVTSDLNLNGLNIDDIGVLFLKEQADADTDVAGSGQIWVDTATPNVLYFTDDAGTDFRLSYSVTGSGSLVLDTSPTIVTPTIASFANAGHDHSNAAGGGNLGVVQATNLTLTGAAAATPVANRLYADNIVKGWVHWSADGTVNDSVNVTTVDDDGVGDWGINWVTAFTSANFAVSLCAESTTSGQNLMFIGVDAAGMTSSTTEVIAVNNTDSTTEIDPDAMYCIAVGAQ